MTNKFLNLRAGSELFSSDIELMLVVSVEERDTIRSINVRSKADEMAMLNLAHGTERKK